MWRGCRSTESDQPSRADTGGQWNGPEASSGPLLGLGAMVCAQCGSENAPNVCSACRKVNYCSRKCQIAHWKHSHKHVCSGNAKGRPAQSGSASTARSVCPECAKDWAECTCTDRPACWICLESEGGDLLRGCACRGSAEYVHVACMVEANRHRREELDK